MGIAMFHEGIDFAGWFLDGGERASADGLLGDDSEPAFDLIDPGGASRGAIHVVSGPARQPRFDFGVLAGGVVVDDEVDIQVARDAL